MDRYVMRHPQLGGPALIPESSMPMHSGQGWLRVSGAIPEADMDRVRVADYADAPDLDADPEPVIEPDPDPPVSPATSTKEK